MTTQIIDGNEEIIDPQAFEKKREEKNALSRFRAILAYMGISIPEALNFSSIFLMLHHAADFLFNTPMRFFVFPAAAIYGMTKAGLLWRNFSLTYQNYKQGKATLEETKISFLQALWETLNGLGTTGAVITGIVGFITGAVVGMGISITFNFFLAASTAICAAYAGFFAYRAYQTNKEFKKLTPLDLKNQHPSYVDWNKLPDNEKTKDHPLYKEWSAKTNEQYKTEHPLYKKYLGYRAHALNNLAFTGIVALLTIGVAVSMVAGFTLIGGIIGVAGCLIAAGYTAYNIYKFVKGPKPASPSVQPTKNPDNNTLLHKKVSNRKRANSEPDMIELDDLSSAHSSHGYDSERAPTPVPLDPTQAATPSTGGMYAPNNSNANAELRRRHTNTPDPNSSSNDSNIANPDEQSSALLKKAQ